MLSRTQDIRSWYDCPHWYDIAFQDETAPEADFLEAALRKYLPRKAHQLLEPACGTGRLMVEMAARGYAMTGFDLNAASLDFLRRELKRRNLRAKVLAADMADFVPARPEMFAAAFCTFDSFRHLLTEDAARRHLEAIAAAVQPGGIYILGFHLLPPDASEECTERWTQKRGGTCVTTTLRVIASNRRARVERLRISMLARTAGRMERVRDEFDLRLYTAAQFRRLLASVPTWELLEVYDFWYEIDKPLKLTNELGDAVFVLRKMAHGN